MANFIKMNLQRGFAITAILLALPFQGSNINCQDEFFTHSLVSYTSFRGGNTISKEDHFEASFLWIGCRI